MVVARILTFPIAHSVTSIDTRPPESVGRPRDAPALNTPASVVRFLAVGFIYKHIIFDCLVTLKLQLQTSF